MDGELATWIDTWRAGASGFGGALLSSAQTLLLPSRLTQVAVTLAMMALAWVLARALSSRFEAWMRGLEGRPKWQLRLLIVLRRRLALTLFVALIWLAVGVFAAIYQFPSRRYLLELFATIASAWSMGRMMLGGWPSNACPVASA